MLETLDYTIRIGSTPTFLYFDLYLHSAYAAHYINFSKGLPGSTQSKQWRIELLYRYQQAKTWGRLYEARISYPPDSE